MFSVAEGCSSTPRFIISHGGIMLNFDIKYWFIDRKRFFFFFFTILNPLTMAFIFRYFQISLQKQVCCLLLFLVSPLGVFLFFFICCSASPVAGSTKSKRLRTDCLVWMMTETAQAATLMTMAERKGSGAGGGIDDAAPKRTGNVLGCKKPLVQQ